MIKNPPLPWSTQTNRQMNQPTKERPFVVFAPTEADVFGLTEAEALDEAMRKSARTKAPVFIAEVRRTVAPKYDVTIEEWGEEGGRAKRTTR